VTGFLGLEHLAILECVVGPGTNFPWMLRDECTQFYKLMFYQPLKLQMEIYEQRGIDSQTSSDIPKKGPSLF
jgi:hypothetical protein